MSVSMSPELETRIYWAVGRLSHAGREKALKIGSDLCNEIERELNEAYRKGVAQARSVQSDLIAGRITGGPVTVSPGGAGGGGGSGRPFPARGAYGIELDGD